MSYKIENSSGQPSEPVSARFDRVRNGKFLKVFLKDITPQTRLYRVTLKKGNQTWTVQSISPLAEGTFEADLEGKIHDN